MARTGMRRAPRYYQRCYSQPRSRRSPPLGRCRNPRLSTSTPWHSALDRKSRRPGHHRSSSWSGYKTGCRRSPVGGSRKPAPAASVARVPGYRRRGYPVRRLAGDTARRRTGSRSPQESAGCRTVGRPAHASAGSQPQRPSSSTREDPRRTSGDSNRRSPTSFPCPQEFRTHRFCTGVLAGAQGCTGCSRTGTARGRTQT
mmetsp:Transcript_55011/g.126544  ORF Transcript_55011/g.126544 Transcript_55011/m.126544 type:complete len:200 (+) Transcript_55011:1044-1643(+)